MSYWLVKSEPETFSFDDLMAAEKRTTNWDGIRNFTARNHLRDGMKVGDRVFFYHSNANPPAIVGICEVVRAGYPEKDEKWFQVDLKAIATKDWNKLATVAKQYADRAAKKAAQ